MSHSARWNNTSALGDYLCRTKALLRLWWIHWTVDGLDSPSLLYLEAPGRIPLLSIVSPCLACGHTVSDKRIQCTSGKHKMKEEIHKTAGYKPVDEAEIVEISSSSGYTGIGIHCGNEAWQKRTAADEELGKGRSVGGPHD